jgi:hypothetical protein
LESAADIEAVSTTAPVSVDTVEVKLELVSDEETKETYAALLDDVVEERETVTSKPAVHVNTERTFLRSRLEEIEERPKFLTWLEETFSPFAIVDFMLVSSLLVEVALALKSNDTVTEKVSLNVGSVDGFIVGSGDGVIGDVVGIGRGERVGWGVGRILGCKVGRKVGTNVVGAEVGDCVGVGDGRIVGDALGKALGNKVGDAIGESVGYGRGWLVETVGWSVGETEGRLLGIGNGTNVGAGLGTKDGVNVGTGVGIRVGWGMGGVDVGAGVGFIKGVAVGESEGAQVCFNGRLSQQGVPKEFEVMSLYWAWLYMVVNKAGLSSQNMLDWR